MSSTTDYGRDIAMGPLGLGADLDPRFRTVTGARAVAEAVVRRIRTPRGALVSDSDYGLNIVSWINVGMTRREILSLSSRISAEIEKEERVSSVETTSSYDASDETLTIAIDGETADGPFSLVLSVSSAGAAITSLEV